MNEWQKWFEDNVSKYEKLPRQLAVMYRRYGQLTDTMKQCKTCKHLECQSYHNHNYYKCLLYGISRGTATDWRQKWAACGKYEVEEKVLYGCPVCGNQELQFEKLYPNGLLCSVCNNSNRMIRIPDE